MAAKERRWVMASSDSKEPEVPGFSRRQVLLGGSGLLALPALLEAETAATPPPKAAVAAVRAVPDVYQAIGVRPIINARGTYTILSGSTMLPEVREAMAAASQRYVHLDELTDGVGQRLAQLTGAEWGIVTSGCSAALTHAAAACVTGGNPDLHVRLPDLRGFPRDEAILPKHSRNVYDAAIRAVGLRVIEVKTVEELEAAFGPRTALVYILAGPNAEEGPLTTQVLCDRAKAKGVPVLVDAAAEVLTIPNVHLQKGATLVAYSGGKCLRGPQAAGLLLGRKDLVRAAWVSSAPHHGFGRAMKVGKEEAIAMLTAVEMWVKRDHDGEWKRWNAWLDTIARRVSALEGVTTQVVQPEGLSNKTPSLLVLWDRARYGVDGEAVAKHLFETEPRVALFPAGRRAAKDGRTGVSITPYMLAAGEEKTVADRLFGALSSPAATAAPGAATPAADLTGEWTVRIQYAAGTSVHTLYLRQRGNDLDGAHQGDFVAREVSGTIDGDAVKLRSSYEEDHGDALNFTFTGKVKGDELAGDLDM